MLPKFTVALPASVMPLWKCPHRGHIVAGALADLNGLHFYLGQWLHSEPAAAQNHVWLRSATIPGVRATQSQDVIQAKLLLRTIPGFMVWLHLRLY